MNYDNFSYPQLKHECARLGLGGSGDRETLTARLAAHQPEPEPDGPRIEPVFSNWDENGNWIRRPKNFVSWADEARKRAE